jgi:hypothetical protein
MLTSPHALVCPGCCCAEIFDGWGSYAADLQACPVFQVSRASSALLTTVCGQSPVAPAVVTHGSCSREKDQQDRTLACWPPRNARWPQGVYAQALRFFALFQQHTTPERARTDNQVTSAAALACALVWMLQLHWWR